MDATIREPRPGDIIDLAGIGRYWAEHAPDRIALTAGERSWSFGELDTEAQRVAQGLLSLDVAPASRIAYLDKNTPEYFTHLFGGAKINAVSVAVNWRLAPPEMEFIIHDAEAEVLFVGADFLEHFSKMDLPLVRKVIVIGDPGHSGHERYDDWVAGFEPVEPDVEIQGDDTCYQLYTSGTTGLPKGVELTNDNFIATMTVGRIGWKFDASAVNLVAMPLFHIAGSGWALAGMVNGAHTVMTKEVDPVEIIELIPRFGITHALLVPAVLQFILGVPGASGHDYSSMRTLVYGASPISEAVLVGSMALFGCEFVQAYGLTETTGGVVQLDPEDHDPGGDRAHLLRAAGKPWGDVELRIVDTDSLEDAVRRGGGGGTGALRAGDEGVLEEPRGDAVGDLRRLVPHRRRRLHARRLPVHPRPGERHDRLRWREHLPGRGRERAHEAPRHRRRRRHRCAE